jgi:hypothetical protein
MAAAERRRHERAVEQVARQRKEDEHAEAAAEDRARRQAAHRVRAERVVRAPRVPGEHPERRQRAQRLDPRKALFPRLVDPCPRTDRRPHGYPHGADAIDRADTVQGCPPCASLRCSIASRC